MLGNIVKYSLNNLMVIAIVTLVLSIGGAFAFKNLPIEAYPDIADTWVQVIGQWPGHAAEEVEKQLTVPLEISLNSVPHHTQIRSTSLFGLSVVTLIFDEKTDVIVARQSVLERLSQVQLPAGVQPTLGPMSSPVSQIFFYYLESKRSVMELKEIEDWDLEKAWKQVAGVADVSSFGGLVKQYQVLVDPLALANYGLSTSNLVQSLSTNNQNSGGGFISRGSQTLNIRGVGRADNIADINNVILAQKSGTPIRVKNVAKVGIGSQPRLGKVSLSKHRADGSVEDRDDVVEGIVLSRVGEVDENVLKNIHEKVAEINSRILPQDVKLVPFLDRSELIRFTTRTVEENMVVGMVLVFIILLFFLGHLRSALIVSATIPLSLLFASIMLDLKHIPANLLSLGALDFGMIVDAAVVMIENIFRHRQEQKDRGFESTPDNFKVLIMASAKEVQKPIVFAILIIILSYLPIFTLQRVEGRLFSPMAWTVSFALLGAMLVVLTVVPVMAYVFLRADLNEWHNPFVSWIEEKYHRALAWSIDRPRVILSFALVIFCLTVYLFFGGAIGSEFLPHLDEGSIWVRGTLPPSTSYEMADQVVKKARKEFMNFKEVSISVCQIGRPDDGTDATGFFNSECFVGLKPHAEWRKDFKNKDELIAAIDEQLGKIPGVVWNFSQPISDNVEEMLSGVKGAIVVKLSGDDLGELTLKINQIKDVLAKVKGIVDLGIFEELGQPNVNIVIDRDKIAQHGLNISDVQDVIETAVGGKSASQIIQGEKRFDLVVRYRPEDRQSVESIRRILVATPQGYRVPLEELAQIKIEEGASMIYREENKRFIALKFGIRGRDLGGVIEEAQDKVKRAVPLPEGYSLGWTGEFESQRRAEARLRTIVPLTILAILLVLYFFFGSMKWALIVVANVIVSRVGGVLALLITGTNFSVSSGIGFLAVFGVSIQTGILLVSYINNLRRNGMPIHDAIVRGSGLRLRPIMMTALVATFGLLPAAMSHAIGSDSQRPMAIVIVGGLLTDIVVAFFLLPTLYKIFAKDDDKL
jgi:cobalt-zinc-cadmium resistance protein CzcA